MVFWHGIAGIAVIRRRCAGLWRYLIERDKGRAAIELERERNRATAEALRLLPGDCELLEYEREGRLRVIRKSGQGAMPPAVPGEILPPSTGQLDR